MKKILIVEDDSVVAHIYQGCLQKAGYQIEVAADGQMGLERLEPFQPDGILLDLMIPKISGIDLLKAIRDLPDFKNVPVIVYTNAYIPTTVEDAIEAGATNVFDKAQLTPALLTREFASAWAKDSD